MTFLCTVDGELVPGHPDGKCRTKIVDGVEFYDWPTPWALQCCRCDLIFEYGANHQEGPDEHYCNVCLPIVRRERSAERHGRPVQLSLDVFA